MHAIIVVYIHVNTDTDTNSNILATPSQSNSKLCASWLDAVLTTTGDTQQLVARCCSQIAASKLSRMPQGILCWRVATTSIIAQPQSHPRYDSSSFSPRRTLRFIWRALLQTNKFVCFCSSLYINIVLECTMHCCRCRCKFLCFFFSFHLEEKRLLRFGKW